MAEIGEVQDSLRRLEKHLTPYLAEIKTRAREEPRKILFGDFLREVFQVKIEDFSRLMEKFVSSKALLVKGHVDAVFGSLVLEFKSDLKSGLEDARDELTKYLQALREEEPTSNYLGIATDGVEFRVFKPVWDEAGVIRDLRQFDSIDLGLQSDRKSIYLWFDSYLFSSNRVAPTTEDLKRRFGIESPTYSFLQEELLGILDDLKGEGSVKLKLSSWSRYLEIAYGTSLGSSELFVKHTYLATLAKLFIFERVEQGRIPTRAEIPDVIDGTGFRKAGITNLVDEDFFTWILHPKVRDRVAALISSLLKELRTYDLTQISEDIFKELYQELVDPDIRHDLGEYYTPDWMAQYIVNKLLDEKPTRSVIDPSCGSGTFLFSYLRESKKRLRKMDKKELLRHLLSSTAGIDIHPLAVIIARTNFILAIQDLLPERTGPITIPIYLSDAIRLPPAASELEFGSRYHKVLVDEKRYFALPDRVLKQRWVLDQVAQSMHEAGRTYGPGTTDVEDSVSAFSKALSNIWVFQPGDERLLLENFRLLLKLIDENNNSIWTFIIRNIYQPIGLSARKFDTVIGNPPWLVMRQISNPTYQHFLKEEAREFGLLDPKQTHLFPHLEVATVFWCKAASLYLKVGGQIAFVLPRSVLVAQHHAQFLRFAKPKARLETIIDFEKVSPQQRVFNVPSCALIAEVGPGRKTTYPVAAERFVGEIGRRNAGLEEALVSLQILRDTFSPNVDTKRTSPYFDLFFQGASMVPRAFWFITPVSHPSFGVDPVTPRIRSDSNLEQHQPWIGVSVEGNTEAQFIFGTLLGGDLVPFAHTALRPVVLPVLRQKRLELISSSQDALKSGYPNLSGWLGRAETHWNARSTTKSRGAGLYKYLDTRRKLTNQNPDSKFKVLFTASSGSLTACVLDLTGPVKVRFDEHEVRATAFIAESKTYWFDTNNESEAHYLSAILNSRYANQAIKASQTRGLLGPRDIHKRPLRIPFPRFSKSNDDLARLAELGRLAYVNAMAAIPAALRYKSPGKRREVVRTTVTGELDEIDSVLLRVLRTDNHT